MRAQAIVLQDPPRPDGVAQGPKHLRRERGSWIGLQQGAQAQERVLLLGLVADAAQGKAPGLQEVGEVRGEGGRASPADAAEGDCGVLDQGLVKGGLSRLLREAGAAERRRGAYERERERES